VGPFGGDLGMLSQFIRGRPTVLTDDVDRPIEIALP
jgi:hypothetical protein